MKPKSAKKHCPVELNDFYDFYKGLFGETPNEPDSNFRTLMDQPLPDNYIDDLDCRFTEEEIINTVKGLKRGKSPGYDKLMPEMFLVAAETLAPVLCKLFNYMFWSFEFPEDWTYGIVVPIHKKDNLSDPNNYRPITLVSVFSKIFTTLLNQRLLSWAESSGALTEFQFGFRTGKSTVDAIYVLHGLITHSLTNKEKLFSAFVDFRKAFDRVDRRFLWYKLLVSGCSSRMIKMIKSIYQKVNICIRSNGQYSDYFENYVGVKQGEPLSPLMFLFFINDITSDLKYSEDTIDINGYLINLLLFAVVK